MKRLILGFAALAMAGAGQAAITVDSNVGEGSAGDLWQNATVNSTSGILNGFRAQAAFGDHMPGTIFPEAIDGRHTIFNDSPSLAFINFTPTAATAIRKIVGNFSGDLPNSPAFRAFSNIEFFGSNDGVTFTSLGSTLVGAGASRVTLTFNTPQSYSSYRFEGVQNNGGGRILELDAFAAVPEPATWAMMILGFAMIGGAMRKRARPNRLAFA